MGDLEAIINETIEVVQPMIKKPKLTPKLLGKPPFRFLHDVVSQITQGTGFAEGLFGPDEQNAGAIKDKDAKLAYLGKIHEYVCAAAGEDVPLKLGKVVAGMEPEKTNVFLQRMATLAQDGSVNRDAALKAVLGGGDDDGGADAAAEAEAAKEAERQAAAAREAQAAADAAAAKQAAAAAAAAAEAASHQEDAGAAAADMERQQREEQEKQWAADQKRAADEQARQAAEAEEEMRRRAAAAETEGQEEPRAPGGVAFADQDEDGGMPPPPQMQERRQLPARPTTARRPPPKLPSKEVKVERREKPRNNEGPPQPVAVVVGVVAEGAGDEEEEEEEEEVAPALPGWDLGDKEGDEVVEGEQHGALVGDILAQKKKQKEGEGDAAPSAEPAQEGIIIIKKDKRRGSLSSSQGKRAPQQSTNDIHKLRSSIQQLCQSTTPLGKCVEGVQADLEHMEREFRMWKAEGQANSRKLEQTSNNTEQHLQPLQAQEAEELQKIKDMKVQIDRVKANIMQNNMTIHSLLRGVVAGHRN